MYRLRKLNGVAEDDMRVGRPVLGMPAWAAGLVLAGVAVTGWAVLAQDRTASGQGLLKVDWADPEIASSRMTRSAGGGAPTAASQVQLPVLAFDGVPQIVKNVAGADAAPIKPRSFVSDPKQPYWYHLTDTYDGISISIDADRRVNVEGDAKFQIGGAAPGSRASARAKGGPAPVSISDGAAEGMEGIVIQYTVQKFPDIPYTVTIECSTKAKAQCKDLAVINKDQAMLKVISAGSQ